MAVLTCTGSLRVQRQLDADTSTDSQAWWCQQAHVRRFAGPQVRRPLVRKLAVDGDDVAAPS
eukprot:3820881-Rhodomonas_salina.1